MVLMPSWDLMTWKEFESFIDNSTVAILPVGSVEQHGPHLPLGLDYLIVDELCRRLVVRAEGEGLKVVKLPPIPYGLSAMWLGNPGTIDISSNSFINYVYDVLKSVVRWGITKLVVLNGHAGNSDALRLVASNLVKDLSSNYVVVVTSWWELVGDVINEVFESKFFHADEVETSVALALGVRVVEVGVKGSEIFRRYDDFWHSLDLSRRPKIYVYRFEGVRREPGSFGTPEKASYEKGLKIVNTVVDRLLKLIKELIEGKV